jgi:hypothetical protein
MSPAAEINMETVKGTVGAGAEEPEVAAKVPAIDKSPIGAARRMSRKVRIEARDTRLQIVIRNWARSPIAPRRADSTSDSARTR